MQSYCQKGVALHLTKLDSKILDKGEAKQCLWIKHFPFASFCSTRNCLKEPKFSSEVVRWVKWGIMRYGLKLSLLFLRRWIHLHCCRWTNCRILTKSTMCCILIQAPQSFELQIKNANCMEGHRTFQDFSLCHSLKWAVVSELQVSWTSYSNRGSFYWSHFRTSKQTLQILTIVPNL